MGFNLGYDAIMRGEEALLKKTVSEFAVELSKRGFAVEFFALSKSDVPKIVEVVRIAGLKQDRIWCDFSKPGAFLKQISSYDIVIGQRLHAVVAACGYGIPCISLSYLPKCLHFMESMDIKKFAIDTKNIEICTLDSVFSEILINYKDISRAIVSRCEKYQKLQMQVSSELKRIVMSKCG